MEPELQSEPQEHLARPWEQAVTTSGLAAKPLTRRTMQPEEPIFNRIEIAALLEMITHYSLAHPIFAEEFLQELETKIENLG